MAKWQSPGAAVVALVVAVSPVGYWTIKSHEGLGQPGRAVQAAYPDAYLGWRKATICYGHTLGVKPGDLAPMAQCEEWLSQDIVSHCKLVYDAVLPMGVWLSQGEQDAYCSFAYNLGKFKGTDSVFGRLQRYDDWGACMGLLKYYYSDGRPSRGLWERRYSEYNLCVSQLTWNRYGRR